MDLRNVIPGYASALEQESLIREVPVLGINDQIGPFTVRLITVRDFIALKRHPLLSNQPASIGQIVAFIRFLWVGNRKKPTLARWLFGRRCLKYVKGNFEEMEGACLEYLSENLLDAISGSYGNFNAPICSEAVDFISQFSTVHGWSPEYTLNLPLILALQYKRWIEQSNGVQPANRSDKMIADYTLSLRKN